MQNRLPVGTDTTQVISVWCIPDFYFSNYRLKTFIGLCSILTIAIVCCCWGILQPQPYTRSLYYRKALRIYENVHFLERRSCFFTGVEYKSEIYVWLEPEAQLRERSRSLSCLHRVLLTLRVISLLLRNPTCSRKWFASACYKSQAIQKLS